MFTLLILARYAFYPAYNKVGYRFKKGTHRFDE